MATGTAIPADAVSGAPQVNVLAFPPVTTGRVLILVAAMLAAGLFVGTTVFMQVAGASLSAVAAQCSRVPPWRPGGPDLFSMCLAPVQGRRAAFGVGAAALVALGAMAVLFLAPVLIERRRRLRLAGPSLAPAVQRMQALAREAGLRRPPTLVVGPTALRDAFCYGRPGRYRVAVPSGLAIRPASVTFEAVLRHELAHVAHRDVALSWMARSVWYALTPMLLLPLVLCLVHGDVSVVPGYLWRAAVLAAVVLLAQRAVLQSREYDADLRADQLAGSGQALAAVLASIRPLPATRLRRALAYHPDKAVRLDVLRNPQRAAAVTVVDGITVAFLATLTLPILDSVLYSVLVGGQHLNLIQILSAVLIGPLMGATLGLGLWRESLVSRVIGTPTRITPVTLGVFGGGVLGQAVSFATVGLPGIAGLDKPLLIFVVALGLAGATVVVAGLGEVWADATGRFRRPSGNWLPATLLSAALFSGVLWAGDVLKEVTDLGGWSLASGAVMWASQASPPLMVILALVIAAATGWALWAAHSGGWAPPWLVAADAPARWSRPALRAWQAVVVGVVSGLAGSAVEIGFRLVAGPPGGGDDERLQRFYTYVWLAAVVGAVAALLLALMNGRPGRGAALLAGPVATATASTGYLGLNTVLGGALTLDFSSRVLQPALTLGFLLSVALAWLTLLAPPLRLSRTPTALAVILAAVMAAGGALGVVGWRDLLVPNVGRLTATESPPAVTTALAAQIYKIQIGPDLFVRRVQLEKKASAIAADPSLTPAGRAERYRGEILMPLRALLADAESYVPPDDRVMTVHQRCVAALRLAVAANEDIALAWELNNQVLRTRGQVSLHRESTRWQTWASEVAQL
ncbi:MAG: M48 family metallopeptidase [Pseudonocardiaceae bacterium]